MADTPYLDSSLQTGYNNSDVLALKLETQNNLDRVLNQNFNPDEVSHDFYADPEVENNISERDLAMDIIKKNPESFTDFLSHPNAAIRETAQSIVLGRTDKDPFYKNNVGGTNVMPFDKSMDKFLDKDFGYRFDRDNEDYYYRNDYMDSNWFARNLVYNPSKFLARTIVPAILKFGEGFGYIGSMIGSIGSDNYWADVADNGFSNWLSGLEEDFKNEIVPVYKQAGFDEKGFFSKLGDWSFWNDSVADGLAFMASAAIPAGGLGLLGKAGKLGKFGQAFSTTSKAGKFASKVGVGSGAELTSLAFNTGMEAATEASGVFKDAVERMENLRGAGDDRYANLTDSDIRERAGKLARNTFMGNLPVLLFSNAFENTIFFKPFKKVDGHAASLTDEFRVASKSLDNLESKGFLKSSLGSKLSRTRHYGGQALTATGMEGYWEENSQLAIQRMNTIDEQGNIGTGKGFFGQLFQQTKDATFGNDTVAAESIGLGALIGVMGSAGVSKFSGERRQAIDNTRRAIEQGKIARQRLFETNDIYERDDKGHIVFGENNEPKVSPEKLKAKAQAFEQTAQKIAAGTKDEFLNSRPVQYTSQKALADYVRSLGNIGVEGVAERMQSLNPETASLFGLDPQNVNAKVSEYASLAKSFEDTSKSVNEIKDGKKSSEESDEDFKLNNAARKGTAYRLRTDNAIINNFVSGDRGALTELVTKDRNLPEAQASDFVVDNLNSLLIKRKLNKDVMASEGYKNDMSDIEQKFHQDLDAQLADEIEKTKTNNQDALKEAKTENGYYVPSVKNPNVGRLKTQIAGYENTIAKNTYLNDLISHPETGYENYKRLSGKLLDNLEKAAKNSPQGKLEEKLKKHKLNEGDNFSDINRLVAKMVFGSNQQYSDKELQLQQNYPELIEDMLKEFEKAVETQREKLLKSRLDNLKKEQDKLVGLIYEKNFKIGEKRNEIEKLVDDLKQSIEENNEVKRVEIEALLNKLQDDIFKVEEAIEMWNTQLGKLDYEIELLEQEVKGGDFVGLMNPIEELKKEKAWVEERIEKTKGILDKLNVLIDKLIGIAKLLFGNNWNPQNLDRPYTDKVYGANFRARYNDEFVELFDRINLNRARKEQLTNYVAELESTLQAITDQIKQQSETTQSIIKETEQFFLDRYVDLTKDTTAQNELDKTDEDITNSLTGDMDAFPNGINSFDQSTSEEEVYDGATYLRPLHTKFTTTTLPEGEYESYPQDVKDFVDFTENFTSMSNKDLSKKLGKGKIKALVVTRNNVAALGLGETLLDKQKYFANENPAETHFEIIPVIEDGGFMYFIDKDLNRIGKVGEKLENTNLIRRSLRLPKFKDSESQAYLIKHTQKDLDDAVSIATKWREKTLEESAKNPKVTINFAVTRGIANKMKNEDGSQVKNSVGKTLLEEGDIQGNSVQVFAKPDQSVNGEYITMPVGRPFIYTSNGVHSQFHYADNNRLSDDQIKVVSSVLKALLKDHADKVKSVISTDKFKNNKDNKVLLERIEKVGGIENLTNEDKKQLYAAVTKKDVVKGFKLFNANYTKYLSSIIYFGAPRDEKGNKLPPKSNQVYFKGPFLQFGDGIKIDITNPELIDGEGVQAFLGIQFHNVKFFSKPNTVNGQYTEYILDKEGNLKTRNWKTYSHYLLSEKNPDGTSREVIPITTSIKTKTQYDAEANPLPSRTYNYRGLSLTMEQSPVVKKTTATENVKKEEQKKEKNKQEKKGLSSIVAQLRGLDNQSEEDEDVEEVLTEQEPEEDNGLESRLLGMLGKQKAREEGNSFPKKKAAPKSQEEEDDNIIEEESEEDVDAPPGNLTLVTDEDEEMDDEEDLTPMKKKFFRVASNSGPFRTESDLNAVVADIHRMVPQFPVSRLKEIIRTTDGVEAWGQFVDGVIKLYELAEVGTGYHEVFEAVANRLLTDTEWNALEKEFKGRKGSFIERETGKTLKFSEATSNQVKEQLAEEFRDFKLNKSEPKEKNIKFYLRMIWDFIKQLFSKSSEIKNTFSAIDQSKFATRKALTQDRFESNFRKLPELPVKIKRDLFDGATTYMFQNILLGPKSLTVLDDMSYTDQDLYEPIREQFKSQLEEYRALPKKNTKISNAIQYLDFTLNNWKRFVEAHKGSLKKYGIKFRNISEIEEDVVLEPKDDSADNKNQNDYTQDIFTLNAKKSASTSIKFLFGTMIKSKFNLEGGVNVVNNNKVGDIDYVNNEVFLPNLVNYDEYMLKALDEFNGLSDFTKIEERLKQLAGIDIFNNIQNPEAYKRAMELMSNEQAVWTSLYMRLFSDRINPEAAMKMKVRLQNYVSKHAPQPFVMLYGGGTSSIVSSIDRVFYEETQKKIEQGIMSKRGKMFKLDYQTQNYIPASNFRPMVMAEFVKENKPLGMIDLLGLSDVITPIIYNKLAGVDRIRLNQLLFKIREELLKVNTPSLTFRNLNIGNYSKELIDFMNDKLRSKQLQSQFLNADNEPQQIHVLPSFASRVLNEMNNVKTKEELFNKFPHLRQSFAKDSIVLNKLFDKNGNRNDVQVSLGYVEAIKDTDEQAGTKVEKLEFTDRYYLQFQASLQGLYYTIPADSSTEWVFNFGEFVPYSENLLTEQGDEIINTYFLPKLHSEIGVAKEGTKGLLQLEQFHNKNDKEAGRPIGKSLRFFKDILKDVAYTKNKSLLQEIYDRIDKGESANKILSSKKVSEAVREGVRSYINNQVNITEKTLEDNRLYTMSGENFVLSAVNGTFLSKYPDYFSSEEGRTRMTPTQFKSLLEYQKINSLLGSMETFKIVFGDPAQYKDFEKRAKSLLGPTEQTFEDSTGEFNKWLNETKNSAVLGDERVELNGNDWFNTEFGDHITERTVDDLEVVDINSVNSLKRIKANYAEKYEKNNETDGESAGTIGFARHLFIKSGWRWSDEHERFYQYDTALMRQELSKLPKSNPSHYDYKGNTALAELDKKIIEDYKKNPANVKLSPVKTLMAYVDPITGAQSLIKHSVYFMSYQLAKEFELLDVYVELLKGKDSLLNFKSTKKIGLAVDNNGEITSYYQNPFERTDLDAKGNPRGMVDMRTIGIQVETQGGEWGQTLGSQTTKDINLNLFEEGVPTDFLQDKSFDERYAEWNKLDEAQKMTVSANYRKVFGEEGTITTLENLKTKSSLEKLTELGVRWSYNNGQISYNIDDLTKVKDYIYDELQRLDIDDNTLDAIQLTKDLKEFENPAEVTPSYTTISNLLWAIADKSVTGMKVNGKSLIQVSSAFFNKSKGRSGAYKDAEGNWVEVKTKAEYDALPEDVKSKVVMTSSELSFYSLNEGGTEINAMEIYLPDIYIEKVNKARKAKGLKELSAEELMEYLNKNPKLLEGVGFRIPTQDTASIEFFKIKGFLPKIMGDAVVVPSALTTKAGSDFDVDKLNTYLNNFKLNKDGLPLYEEFLTDENSTVEQRYTNTFGKRRKLLQTVEQYLLKTYEKEILNNSTRASVDKLHKAIFKQLDDVSFYSEEEIEEVLSESQFRNTTYKELLKGVRDEIKTSPTLEQFKQFPLFLQNTRGAVENMYFQAIRNVLKSPEMLEALLHPISTQHIKDNKLAVQAAKEGISVEELKKKEKNKEIRYDNFLSTEFIADKRNQFAKGKNDIAIFAIAMTNFANSQVTGLGIAEIDAVDPYDMMVFEDVNQGMIDLPFDEIPVHFVNGVKFIPISKLKDSDGRFTMSKISAYISGAVDVAKEPDIIEMGMHSELAGVYMLLERMGLSGEMTSLFLYQPAIRDYLKELLFRDNKTYFGYSPFKNKKEMIEELLLKYFANKPYNPNYRFTKDELVKLIAKGELVKQGKATFSAEENHAQFIALANFLKLKIFSDHLLKTIMATNHDTSSIRSSHVLTKKELQLDAAKRGNLIVQMKGEEIINGAEAIINTTAIKTDKQLLNMFDSVMSDINLFALRKHNPRTALRTIAARVFSQNPYISNDDFIAVMKQYEVTLLDSIVNKVEIPGINENDEETYNALYKFSKQYFHVDSTTSIKNQFDRLKKLATEDESYKKYKKFFKNNFFLKNLQFNTDLNLGVHLMDLKVKPTNADILSKEMITEGLIEMAELDVDKYPELVQLYKSVIYGAYIQFGIRFSRNSFLNLIPVALDENIGLMDLTKPALDNIENQDFSTLDEQVQRTSWFKKGVVPKKLQKAVTFLVPNGQGQFELEQRTTWKYKGPKTKPTAYNQIFFGRRGADGEIVPYIHPIFIWGGMEGSETDWEMMPDTIAIQAIKPEYLWYDINEYGRVDIKPKKKVKQLMDNGDFKTPFFTQLFKKVGVEDPSYSRSTVTKGKEGTASSVLYLYKPINKLGAPNFNEFNPVQRMADGTIVGLKSMLNHPPFQEYADSQIVTNINDPKGRIGLGTKLASIEAVTPKRIATGKPKFTPKVEGSYKWARTAKNNFEVSSKGTPFGKKFSALFAKIQRGTPVDLPTRPEYVLERDVTIEELYQVGVKGHASINKGKGKAPLHKISKEETWTRYKNLWKIWAEQNTELMNKLAEEAKGKVLTDMFAHTEVSQARALAEILNEMFPVEMTENENTVSPPDVPSIEIKCQK
jgi:hypothetical protein